MSEAIFDPTFQDEFWRSVDPDNVELLKLFERKESWTVKYTDVPIFYDDMSELLPDILSFDPNGESAANLLDDIIKITAAMTLKNNMAALIWLDSGLEEGTFRGWSSNIYARCEFIEENKDAFDSNFVKLARISIERIQLMIRLKLLVDIFS